MEHNFPPFYVGQKVVGSDYAPIGSKVKKGLTYIIAACHYSPSSNPIANGKYFWYVGVTEWPDHIWLTPKLFAPVHEIPLMTFSEIKEMEKLEILIPN